MRRCFAPATLGSRREEARWPVKTRKYLAGAVSGTALISLAVVAFVMLVSLQTLRNWPLAALGIGRG